MLGAGKKLKHYLGRMFTPLQLYEPDKHNHNPVKHVIQSLKSGPNKIRNDCGKGVLAYHCEAMEYLCDINNCVAWARLVKRLPFEMFLRETPDVSMITFTLWEPVYYRNCTDKAGKVILHPGKFMGFTWEIGEPMTFKVLQ